MNIGDLVRFTHPHYPESVAVGIILDSEDFSNSYSKGTTFTIMIHSGEIKKIHSTVWPECEVISASG